MRRPGSSRECLDRFGRIDLLVNAAGLTDRASFLDADLDDWAKLFAVNARAPFFLMQAAIRAMRERGEGGAIVNILSMNAHCGAPDLAVYSASKGALATLTKNAANAHRFDRIRVNGINMGWAPTAGEKRDAGRDARPAAPAGSPRPQPRCPSAAWCAGRRSRTSRSSCSATPRAR